MVWPSALADTVTPPIASPVADLTAPLSTTSAAAAGGIQAASEIAIAPAAPVNPCAFLIVPLPVRRQASRRDRARVAIFFSSLTDLPQRRSPHPCEAGRQGLRSVQCRLG